jgi:hypothetical protein
MKTKDLLNKNVEYKTFTEFCKNYKNKYDYNIEEYVDWVHYMFNPDYLRISFTMYAEQKRYSFILDNKIVIPITFHCHSKTIYMSLVSDNVKHNTVQKQDYYCINELKSSVGFASNENGKDISWNYKNPKNLYDRISSFSEIFIKYNLALEQKFDNVCTSFNRILQNFIIPGIQEKKFKFYYHIDIDRAEKKEWSKFTPLNTEEYKLESLNGLVSWKINPLNGLIKGTIEIKTYALNDFQTTKLIELVGSL